MEEKLVTDFIHGSIQGGGSRKLTAGGSIRPFKIREYFLPPAGKIINDRK